MHKVVERTRIVPNIHLLRLEAPDVVRRVTPGNFVIVKIDEVAERIPLSVADWDRETGIISIVFMTVGASTHRLAKHSVAHCAVFQRPQLAAELAGRPGFKRLQFLLQTTIACIQLVDALQ